MERKKKGKPEPEKLGCDMISEELQAHVDKEVHDHFKPKKPEPKIPLDPTANKFFLAMMCQSKKKQPLSDYDSSITKSWEKKSNRRYNQVLQLGEQPEQTVPTLKVLSKEDEAITEFVLETGLSKAQLQGKEKGPVHEGSGRKPFVLGEPLMWPELKNILQRKILCSLLALKIVISIGGWTTYGSNL
jgi:hypothetical protein